MSEERKKVIWSNKNLDVEDWKDFLDEECPGVADESEKMRLVAELNSSHLDDERENLNVQLENAIVAIIDAGFWNRRGLYIKRIESGNVKDILTSEFIGRDCDHYEWYGDGEDIRATGWHHDETNYTLYREIKDEDQFEEFLEIVRAEGKIPEGLLDEYTNSLYPYVAKVYGW